MRDSDVAWFAGIFDGEGCISIAKNGNVRLQVGMTDRDVIERLEALFPSSGGISVKHPKAPDGRPYKTQYLWRLSNPEGVREVLSAIQPWLGQRRTAKAGEALEFLANRPGNFNANKAHCAQGHPYSPENTYLDPDTGYRNCRTCRARWAQEARARKPEGWRWRGAPRSCEFCGQEFRPSVSDQRTCNRACASRLRWRGRGILPRPCEVCGREFTPPGTGRQRREQAVCGRSCGQRRAAQKRAQTFRRAMLTTG